MEGGRTRARPLRTPTQAHVAVVRHTHEHVTTDVEAIVVDNVVLGNIVESPITQLARESLHVLARRTMAMAWTLPCHFLSQDARPGRSGAASVPAGSEATDAIRGPPLTAAPRGERTAAVGKGALGSMEDGRDVMSGIGKGEWEIVVIGLSNVRTPSM